MATSRVPRHRNQISLHEKVQIIEEIQNGKKQKEVSESRRLPASTVQNIWASRKKVYADYVDINPNCKKARPCSFPQIDKALIQWFDSQKSRNHPIDGPVLLRKAQSFAQQFNITEFLGNYKWLCGWKKRHGIVVGNISDDGGLFDDSFIGFNGPSIDLQTYKRRQNTCNKNVAVKIEECSKPKSNSAVNNKSDCKPLKINPATLQVVETESIEIQEEGPNNANNESIHEEDETSTKMLAFSCHLCPSENPKTFIDHSSLKKHLRIIHNSTKDSSHLNTIHCSLCFKEFPNKEDYSNHCETVHCEYFSENNLKYHGESSGGAAGACLVSTAVPKTRRKRRSTHEQIKVRYHCPLCGHESIDKVRLAKHMTLHDEEDPSRLQCDVCSLQFFFRQNLKYHLKWEHSRHFLCDVCSNSFPSQALFEKHSLKMNRTDSEFICQICEEDCESQCLFNVHTDWHLKDLRCQQLQEGEGSSTMQQK